SADAVVIGGGVTGGNSGGVFQKLTIPFVVSTPVNTVGDDNFQSPNLWAFDEDQNITIPSTINVDIGTAPTAGQVVASHYVFFDPEGTQSLSGFVDFDADIFGIITSTSLLAASDFLANTSVTYLNPGARGLEPGQDFVSIDPDNPRRILVDFLANTPGDYIRVLTMRSPGAAVPEPGPLSLLVLGFAALGMTRAWRKN